MKKLLFILLIYISFSFTSDTLKSMLSEVFPNEQVSIILKDVELKKYYTNLVFNSFRIQEVPAEKPISPNLQILTSLDYIGVDGKSIKLTPNEVIKKIKDKKFNILKTRLSRDFENPTLYLLGDTRTVIILLPHTYLTKLQKK